MFDPIFDCIEKHFGSGPVGLHEPVLGDVEKQFLGEAIDSGFVSTAGAMVDQFEQSLAQRTDSKYCVAMVNGTAALQLGLLACGVQPGDEVLTQPLTFIATANSIHHCGAEPVFVDINSKNLAMSASALAEWLQNNVEIQDGRSINKKTKKIISACMPMHTYGMAAEIDVIAQLCRDYGIALIEDAAEALGSRYGEKSLGTFGDCGVFSFNGNKVITTGGGGALVTDSQVIATRARHLATTAKVDAYKHDCAAFNFRMPNINAALGCAQLTRLDSILKKKKCLAAGYRLACEQVEGVEFISGIGRTESNFWLSSVLFDSIERKDRFVDIAKERSIQTRSVWQPLHKSLPYRHCEAGDLSACETLVDRVLNLPSMPTEDDA